MKHTTEQWHSIDIEGYEVSTLGRVRSFRRQAQGRIIKPRIDRWGYLFVRFELAGKHRPERFVHRLVALAFIPNPHNKPQVNHINGVKLDCQVKNLEWVTTHENNAHAIRLGLFTDATKPKLSDTKVRRMRTASKKGQSYCALARKFDVHWTTARDAIRGTTWKHV